jgi:hypothetical protein
MKKIFIMSGTMLRVNIFRIVHIGNVLEVEKSLSTLGVFVKRNEITYWPCYDITLYQIENRLPVLLFLTVPVGNVFVPQISHKF